MHERDQQHRRTAARSAASSGRQEHSRRRVTEVRRPKTSGHIVGPSAAHGAPSAGTESLDSSAPDPKEKTAKPSPSTPRPHRRSGRRRPVGPAKRIARFLLGALLLCTFGLMGFLGYEFYDQKPATNPDSVPEASGETPAPPVDLSDTPVIKRLDGWKRADRQVRTAQALLERNGVDQAMDRLTNNLKQSPQHLDTAYHLAQLHLIKQAYPEAQALLEQVLDAEPARVEARRLLADLLVAQSRHREAAAMAEWILEDQSGSTDIMLFLAREYLLLQEPDKALPVLQQLRSMEVDQNVLETYTAQTYLQSGEYDRAIGMYSRMITRENPDSLAFFNLALSYAGKRRTPNVVETLTQAATLFGPDVVRLWIQSAAFDSLRDEALFKSLARQLGQQNGAAGMRLGPSAKERRASQDRPINMEDVNKPSGR